MTRALFLTSILAVVGCATRPVGPSVASSPPSITATAGGMSTTVGASTAESTISTDEAAAFVSPEAPAMNAPESVVTSPAPWASDERAARFADVAVRAWSHSENRSECAPIVPRDLGALQATPRVGRFSGGWAVEFDQRGARGMTAEGEMCSSCGRGTLGVAGTAILAEEVDASAATMRFSDGSFAIVETTEDGSGQIATVVVQGEACAYQVWSFTGEAPLRDVIGSLRRAR